MDKLDLNEKTKLRPRVVSFMIDEANEDIKFENGIAAIKIKILALSFDENCTYSCAGIIDEKFKEIFNDSTEIGQNLMFLNKNKELNNEIDPVIGRDKEIKRILEILCRRTKNNPLLIGHAGVGKTAIVEELSRLISIGEVPRCLKNKRIISLDMASTVAGTKYRGEFEERVRKILKEIEENDDIILFIDEIHTLVGAGGAEGAIDASNIFKPALARNKIKCIGATTIEEYKKYIEPEKALDRRFQSIMVDIPDDKTVKEILMKLKSIYEKYHYVKISEEIIDLIMNLTKKYIYDRNEPDKSIDVLDEVCSKTSLKETTQMKKYNELNKELKNILKEKGSNFALAFGEVLREAPETEAGRRSLPERKTKINLKKFG